MTTPASANFPWSRIPEPPAGEARSGVLPGGTGYVAARGSRPGPALLVVAGPGSFPAIQGLFRVVRALDAHRLAGSLLAIPLADATGRDEVLGDPEILDASDVLVMLERPREGWVCAGHVTLFQTGDQMLDGRAQAMAGAFGGRYRVLRSLPESQASPVAEVARSGRPAIRAVLPDEVDSREEGADACFLSLVNLLRSLGMLEGRMTDGEPELVEPVGVARSPVDGFWVPAVRIGQYIRANDSLGTLQDRQGDELGALVSNFAGVVLGYSTVVWARRGDALVDLVRRAG